MATSMKPDSWKFTNDKEQEELQFYIAHKRKDYKKGGAYVPALMRYDPDL